MDIDKENLVRCSRCGNENPETNRFCGMCGELLVPASSAPLTAPVRTAPQPAPSRTGPAPTPTPTHGAVSQTSVAQTPSSQTPIPQTPIPQASIPQTSVAQNLPKAAPPRVAPPVAEQPVPSITGPSFLGLSQPGPARSTKSDPHLEHSSRSLDYLLEDEEEPKRGWGKVLFALIALALVLGFGYLRWRNQGFDWLTSGLKKPAAAIQPADASAPADAAPASSTPAPASGDSSTAVAANQPAAATSPVPSGPGTDAAGSPAPNSTGGAPVAAAAPASTPSSSAPAGNPAAATKDQPAAPAESAAQDSDEKTAEPESTPPPAPKPRPAAKPSAARIADPISEAENYIYGRGGARQDCDRGLKLLRPAAEKANPKAMISLGALYSAGLCTPHDLPTAYRWFALALRKDPDNQAVQTDLQKLWSEMTPPERQLAIKLSQ
jgi:hypothetical protein